MSTAPRGEASTSAGGDPAEVSPTHRAQRIGTYQVLLELARGGMGTVYVARAEGREIGIGGFERLVVIKRPHAHLLANPDAVRRFLEEARVAAQVHHANVVGIHQVGSDREGQFLVLDYVEGDTLDGLIDYASLRRERLAPPIVLRIFLDALAGLHAVHETADALGRPLGILHRDVAAQNLLVGRDGVARLSDFGIAKAELGPSVTDGRYLQGRLLYMAPEYLRREKVDRRLDIYAMGVALWIGLTGEQPWAGATEAQLFHAITTEGLPRLGAAGLSIAPPIEAIVARACHRDPGQRFETARAMLEAIEEVGRHTGWIAAHGEVGEVVERLLGPDLAARRGAIAGRVVAIGASTPDRHERTPVLSLVDEPLPMHRPGRALAAGALAVAVIVAGVLALGGSRRELGGSQHEPQATAAVGSLVAPAAADAGARAEPQAGSPEEPAGGHEAEVALTAVSAARTPPAAPAAARRPAPSASPPPRDGAPEHAASPRSLPDEISTANPYR